MCIGAELPPHHDQILNEISITLTLQSMPGAGSEWPLVLTPAPSGAQPGPESVSLGVPPGLLASYN